MRAEARERGGDATARDAEAFVQEPRPQEAAAERAVPDLQMMRDVRVDGRVGRVRERREAEELEVVPDGPRRRADVACDLRGAEPNAVQSDLPASNVESVRRRKRS